MKKFYVSNINEVKITEDPRTGMKGAYCEGGDAMEASDSYHTFGELYEHRFALFIALCEMKTCTPYVDNDPKVWRSKLQSDGTMYDGWFIMGIGKDKGQQITYHLPLRLWDKTGFAETLDKAPEFDGHTSSDVIERLYNL